MKTFLATAGFLAAFLTLSAEPPAKVAVPPDAQKVVARINELRKIAGLDPVAYDADRSAACFKHAKYLVVHDAEIWANDPLDAHSEKEGSSGFTKEGKEAARSSVISWQDPLPAVEGHFAGIFHRVPLLDPRLKTVAIGRADGTKYGSVSLIDVESGVDRSQKWDKARVIVYPADKQKGLPLVLGNELPCPIPADTDKVGGYPVTAFFAEGAKVTEVKASLKLQNGTEVAVWLSTPEKPADERYQRNTVCMIANDALAPNQVYTATVEAKVDGEAWKQTWSFATEAPVKRR